MKHSLKDIIKNVSKGVFCFSLIGVGLCSISFSTFGCGKNNNSEDEPYKISGGLTFASSQNSFPITQTKDGLPTEDMTIDVSNNDYVKIENNDELVWISDLRPDNYDVTLKVSGMLNDLEESSFKVSLLPPEANSYHISGESAFDSESSCLEITQTKDGLPTEDMTIDVSNNDYVKIENNDELVWNDDSRPVDDSNSVEISGWIGNIKESSFNVTLLCREKHTNIVIDPFPSPLYAHYNCSGFYDFSARDNTGASIQNPNWTIINGNKKNFSIDNNGLLKWDEFLLPGEYSINIECTADNLIAATANVVIENDSQPDYDKVIPFGLLRVNNGVLIGHGNISKYSTLVIPSNVTSIDDNAFRECKNLNKIDFGGFNGSIGENAFFGCSSVMILNLSNVEGIIGNNAFGGCSSLKYNTVTLPKNNSNYKASDLGLGKILMNIDANEIIGGIAVGSFSKDDTKKIVGGWAIPANYFLNCAAITSIDLSGYKNEGGNVFNIGVNAFKGCSSLDGIDLQGFTNGTIGANAFEGCSSLISLNLGNLTYGVIGDNAFGGCSSLSYSKVLFPPNNGTYTTIKLTQGIILLHNDNPLKKVAGCLAIGTFTASNILSNAGWGSAFPDLAFFNCASLQEIDMIGMIGITFGTSSFENCTSLTISSFNANCYVTIGNSAFYGCTSISSVSLIGFSGTIGDYAFFGCTGLKTVNLKNSTTQSIGDYAFGVCSSLVLSADTLPASNSTYSVFSGENGIMLFNSTNNSIAGCLMSGSFTWTEIATTLEWDSIPSGGFSYCSSITSIDLSSYNGTTIAQYSFSHCTSLKKVILSNNINIIDGYAFVGCSSLETIDLSKIGNGEIRANAFNGCVSLTSIDLQNFAGRIWHDAFARCILISEIKLLKLMPNSQIDDDAFANCESIQKIYVNLDSTPTNWGANSFIGLSPSGIIYNNGILSKDDTVDFFAIKGINASLWNCY